MTRLSRNDSTADQGSSQQLASIASSGAKGEACRPGLAEGGDPRWRIPAKGCRCHALAVVLLAVCMGCGGGADADAADAVDGQPDQGGDGIADTPPDHADTADSLDSEAEDATPACGNGVVEAGEECDDGEGGNSDTLPDACRTTCALPSCGDGVRDSGEGCDDGNSVDDDGCTNGCALPSCGDGIVQAGEECDDGNSVETDGCLPTCTAARCGDHVVEAGVEECDGEPDRTCATDCGTTGTQACVDCGWSAACTPPAETCNGSDDDCDGDADEDFPCVQGATDAPCETSCGSVGTGPCSVACSAAPPEACAPPIEICNGLDDDCDGRTDNGFPCIQLTVAACTTSCGSSGTGLCSAGCETPEPSACLPPAESCNAMDDDCDGTTDDEFACIQGALTPCTTSCGSTGQGICSASCRVPTGGGCSPPAEACNGRDDDCDTAIDDGFACIQGAVGIACVTTCGSTGTGICGVGCDVPGPASCIPPIESCNGADDDCDGGIDESFACVRGAPGIACTTTCGSAGTGTCTSSCTSPSSADCTPPPEVCNGVDDDCDTVRDDGFACIQGSASAACTTSCGSTGRGPCSTTCTPAPPASCTAPLETCNGADDDCDGLTDEGYLCIPGQTRSCSTPCGTTHTQTCTSSCSWSACGNLARLRPFTITTNGAWERTDRAIGGQITDGSLSYPDYVSGWVNDDYSQLGRITVDISLGGTFLVDGVRYNMGNVQRAETWNPDRMVSPFGDGPTVAGSPWTGAWATQSGAAVSVSTVTLTFEKTRTAWERDWLFIGEIEVCGAAP